MYCRSESPDMTVLQVTLRFFRNFKEARLNPSPGTTVLHGLNGAGKTNLVEAVHLCALGRSHRPVKDQDLIKRGEPEAEAAVQAVRRDGGHEVSVRLSAKGVKKKQILLNGKPPRRLGEMMGHVTCVIFSPEDLYLVKGNPACRRRFMDMLLCQQSAGYFYELQRYIAALNQRNAVLKMTQGNIAHEAAKMLPVWDEQLVSAGVTIIEKRTAFTDDLDKLVIDHYRYLSGKENETLKIRYKACTEQKAVKASLTEGLERARREDVKRGTTSFGPHREDLVITLNGREMPLFASQGQMRTAALSLKLSEITSLNRQHGEPPVLLLDDVMSELDMKRRALLLDFIHHNQTIVTCTDEADYPPGKTDLSVKIETLADGTACLCIP